MGQPAEWSEFRDEGTGRRVIQLTSSDCQNHPLYYLANTFTSDSKSVVFASNRSGKVDLHKVSLEDGGIERLTDVEGVLPFSGNLIGEEVFYTTSTGELRVHPLGTREDRVIATRPGALLGEVTVSCDGEWVCCLATEKGIPGLLVVRKDGSGETTLLRGARAFYHPQFVPNDPDRLIYSADPPDPRIWTVRRDGTGDRCLYAHSLEEWWVHETFLGSTDRLIVCRFHDGILEVNWDGSPPRKVAELSAWHIASNPDGTKIVCDTHLPDIGLCLVDAETGEWEVLCQTGATNLGSQWREPLPVAADKQAAPGYATMVEESGGETIYGPQWTHPHPSFSPDGKWVAFTSDRTGQPQVYVVEVG
jgi:hypothetical protein